MPMEIELARQPVVWMLPAMSAPPIKMRMETELVRQTAIHTALITVQLILTHTVRESDPQPPQHILTEAPQQPEMPMEEQ